jgi:hypothetical protein
MMAAEPEPVAAPPPPPPEPPVIPTVVAESADGQKIPSSPAQIIKVGFIYAKVRKAT